jgi:molecular chaperone HtpG
LQDIFKEDRKQYEEKWDNLKMFIQYGALTDEKFNERATNLMLFKNTENKYFTLEEYNNAVKINQTDKYNKVVYLYTTNKTEQYSYISDAVEKGYDVLIMDGHLDMHYINKIEATLKDERFARVDADIIDKLIEKEEKREMKITAEQKDMLIPVFRSHLPDSGDYYIVEFEALNETQMPIRITQNEFMRRMKDMSQNSGMNYYADLPNSYNIIVNGNHPLVLNILKKVNKEAGTQVSEINTKITPFKNQLDELRNKNKDKEENDTPTVDKDAITKLETDITALEKEKNEILKGFGKKEKLVKQLIDLALLSNNMLKGENLDLFVKRSVELIK